MTISIWFKPKNGPAEVIDRASTKGQAAYLLGEYRMAFGSSAGVVWAGRKDEMPKEDAGHRTW